MGLNKKGVFFSADALIAIMIILMTLIIAFPLISHYEKKSNTEGDIINVLSSLKIGEINNNYVKTLISSGKINDPNKTVLEQIGEFYVKNISLAKSLATEVLSDLDINENIAIFYNNKIVYIKNSSDYQSASNIAVDNQVISGINEGESVTGYSSKAYLFNDIQTKYLYFGGYLGEGNISLNLNYNGNLTGVALEIAINRDFDVYINENYSGHYTNSSTEFAPKKYPDLSAYLTNFHSGDNTIKISGNNLHITGGYIKITYSNPTIYETPTRYYFPGIEGLINIYDGFYIPGSLNKMNIYLHLNNNATTFLRLGNITVFTNSTNGIDKTFTIDDNYLSGILNYNQISNNTIPIRFGIENISYVITNKRDIDVFSVNDLSGSMDECAISNLTCTYYCESPHNPSKHTGSNRKRCEITPYSSCGGTICGGACSNPHSYSNTTNSNCYKTKLDLSKNATSVFIDSILNSTNFTNRVGLAGYNETFSYDNYHNLSSNSLELKNEVNSWNALGNTCICCGINKAVDDLVNYSNSSKIRSIVVMSDGQANVRCSRQGTASATNDAIQAACQAYQNYGIIVDSVGFGSDSDNATMMAIASCGNGTYYWGDVDQIITLYKQIADDLIQGSYNEQTVITSDNLNMKLYPDSYIEIDYSKLDTPYGVIVSGEKQFSNESFGNFDIAENAYLADARVISYSGARWTQNIQINGINFYNLSVYGNNYTNLGDPYSINIPKNLISKTNNITLTTGLSPYNSSSGSSSDKVIYTLVKNMSSYSPIYPHADGCFWNVQFEDNSYLNFSVPENYSEDNYCYYTFAKQDIGDTNDAISVAVNNLLKMLDFDSNGKIDIKFSDQSLKISSAQVTGIPYTWSTKVGVIRWDQ